MFKPVPFEPAGRRRRRGLPRWLVLLLGGALAGAAGVIYVQERHLPPRLSADASVRLRSALAEAEAEQARLGTELTATTRALATTRAEKTSAAAEYAASHEIIEGLRRDVATLVAVLPPDPRGGSVEVRAGQFSANDGRLSWDLVLSRARASGAALTGVMQLVVEGDSAGGGSRSVTLAPVALSLSGHQILRGSAALPEGFRPRQTTIQVLDRAGGSPLGMRVLLVK